MIGFESAGPFILGGRNLKSRVYNEKISDVEHLSTKIERDCHAIAQNYGSHVLNNVKFLLQTCLKLNGI